jgi:hypothetical protein
MGASTLMFSCTHVHIRLLFNLVLIHHASEVYEVLGISCEVHQHEATYLENLITLLDCHAIALGCERDK